MWRGREGRSVVVVVVVRECEKCEEERQRELRRGVVEVRVKSWDIVA